MPSTSSQEAVGELVGGAARLEPRVRPVRRREQQQDGGAFVEVGAEIPEIPALAQQVADPFLVAVPLGDEPVATVAVQVAPFLDEHGGDVQLLGDHAEVAAQREANLLDRRCVLRDRVQSCVEGGRAVHQRVEEQVFFRLDVRVQRALLDAERPGEVADRGSVVALLGEEAGGLARQLRAAFRHATVKD